MGDLLNLEEILTEKANAAARVAEVHKSVGKRTKEIIKQAERALQELACVEYQKLSHDARTTYDDKLRVLLRIWVASQPAVENAMSSRWTQSSEEANMMVLKGFLDSLVRF